MESPFAELSNLIILSGIVLMIPWLAQALVPAETSAVEQQPLRKDLHGRYIELDVIRGIAIIAVIIIHVSFFFTHSSNDAVSDALAHGVNAAMRFAIPIFFLTSGLLLTPPTLTSKSLWKFYTSKLIRIGLPYLLVYLTLAAMQMPQDFPYSLLTGSASVPFYFVIVLLQLYAIYPFIVDIAQQRWFVFATLALTLLNQLIPLFWTIGGVPTFFQYLFFFVWGIYMREKLITKNSRYSLIQWFVMMGLFIVLYAFFPGAYYNIQPYYGLAVFMLLLTWFRSVPSSGLVSSPLALVGRNTLWIFLLHFPIMRVMFPAIIAQKTLTGIWLYLVASLISIIVSVATAYVVDHVYAYVSSFITKRVFPLRT